MRTLTFSEIFARQAYGLGGLTLDLDEPLEDLNDQRVPSPTFAPMDVRPGGPISLGDFDGQPSHLTMDMNDRMPSHEGAAGVDDLDGPFPPSGSVDAGRAVARGGYLAGREMPIHGGWGDDEDEDEGEQPTTAGAKPWQLTFRNYVSSIGGNKTHSNDAYEKYRAEPFFNRPSTVVDTQTLPDGREVEFRRSDEAVKYSDGTVGREKTIYAVLEGWVIGKVQDEWGATLVRVDPDYRGTGIGSRLTAHSRREWPERGSGGMTPQGYKMNKQVHKMLVQDALARGEAVPPEVLAEYPNLEPAAMPEQVPAQGDPQTWEAPMYIHTPGMKPIEEMESWEKYDAEHWPRIDPERHFEYGHPLQGLFEGMGKPLELGKTEHPKRPSFWYRWPKGEPTYQEAHDFFKKHDIRPDKYHQYSWYKPQVEPGFPKRPAPIKKDSEYGADLQMLDSGEGDTALSDTHGWAQSYAGDNYSEGGGSTIHLGQQQNGPWLAVDLDGTLLAHVPGASAAGQFGKPLPGAAQAMRELKSLGWRISVFTARIGDGPEAEHVASQIGDLLEGYEIPFDDVWIGRKPQADYFVDDKAIPFKGNWPAVLHELTTVGAQPAGGDGEGGPDWHVDEAAGQAAGVAMDQHAMPGYMDNESGSFEDIGTRENLSVQRPPDREAWF